MRVSLVQSNWRLGCELEDFFEHFVGDASNAGHFPRRRHDRARGRIWVSLWLLIRSGDNRNMMKADRSVFRTLGKLGAIVFARVFKRTPVS